MSVNEAHNEPGRALRVALLYSSEKRLADLVRVLEDNGMAVAARYKISAPAIDTVNSLSADVILIDLDESAEQSLDILESLLQSATLPVLFNDNATTEFVVNTANPEWGRRLAIKLSKLAHRHPPPPSKKPAPAAAAPLPPCKAAASKPAIPPAPKLPAARKPEPERREIPPVAHADTTGLGEVWVLGASLGGPIAVREFLSRIPADLPVAFILVQHIGASHLDLLAEQLDRVTPFKVMVASGGHQLQQHQVLLAPVDDRLTFDKQNRAVLKPKNGDSIYSPCIDYVMDDMARCFGPRCHTIVFSGMGNDGEQGCRAIAANGGTVWAQSADSCVISSMPDNARKTGHVSFEGTPDELAAQLVKRFRAQAVK